ncbi:MAG TPA: sensor histidine kinase efflux regulator BaeS [Burkholderiales bacterium]|nr:sensor histidine kinase efflux regulator BaeS [Burkholderiales bacterium]
MKAGITFKLFLAILAASAVAAAAMAIATRLSFQSGFFGYLDQLQSQSLDAFAGRLADEYRRYGDWRFLEGDYGRLRSIAAPPQAVQRLTLLDSERRAVVGNPELSNAAVVRPVVVDKQVVGWIARVPERRISTAADLTFQRQQLRASWIIAGVALAVAALVAVVLARAFLQPLKRVAEATHRLAAGNYATRVEVASEDELGRLAADFNRLAESLERNETLRRRFMADVSHELRTPLAVLSGELEALEDGVRPLTRESLASLRAEIGALGKLVDDLNQLALADTGALAYRKETVDVVPLLAQALDSHRERLAEQGLAVETSWNGAAPVFGDADRLRQMFRNLLENSARYTDRGGRVRVAARREAGRVRVDFEDSAPGVPGEALPQLFERFYRVDASRSRAHGGTGLGLAICRSIVEAHDGAISATPSPLGGLRVSVSLPVAA